DLLPACFERSEILSPIVDARARPIARSARSFEAIDVVPGERRIFRAPSPKVVSDFIERVFLLSGVNAERTQDRQEKAKRHALHGAKSTKWQLDYAGVHRVVINFHMASTRVLGGFISHDSAGVVILLPEDRVR